MALYATQADLGLKFCVFRQNHVSQLPGGLGGGMYLEQTGVIDIFSTLFTGNRSYAGGGMAIINSSSKGGAAGPQVYSCEFRNNHAHRGAGVYVDSNPGGIFGNCTVAGNQAFQIPGFPPASGVGGGFYVNLGGAGGVMSIYNGIVWDNTQVVNGSSVTGSSIQGPDAGLVAVTYSDIEGPSVWSGTGNILADPQFVSAATSDYNLQAGSPCADAGHDPHTPALGLPGIPPDVLDLDEDGGAVTTITPYDLVMGNRREKNDTTATDSGMDGGAASGAIVDMGAHESHGD